MIRHNMAWAALPALLASMALGTGAQAARQRVVPANTVIRAELDDDLSSKTARQGDRFSATLSEEDRSGLPEGTKFEGVVTEVKHPTKDTPGVLDVRFDRAVLPGGARVAASGQLASLDDKDIRRTSSGRLESRHGSSKKFDAKWIGYGAAGGAVLSTILGGKLLKGALLGALGGAAYAYLKKDKGSKSYREVELDRGTDFGIRLNNRVAFTDSTRYRYSASSK